MRALTPELSFRPEGDRSAPLLVWRLPAPRLAIASGPLGGGIGVRHWVLNATVPMSYRRDDPDAHLAELADGVGLSGPGVGLLTGVDVADVVTVEDEGVTAWATVGLGLPTWAAAQPPRTPAPDIAPHRFDDPSIGRPPLPGTINVVLDVPARLADAALVNLVATVAEAKAQALRELDLPATGTPTDAIVLLCPTDGPVAAYGGPRSLWGARVARAAHQAVRTGAATDIATGRPWSHKPV
jgi:adenosylcobinamide amidohydrolase